MHRSAEKCIEVWARSHESRENIRTSWPLSVAPRVSLSIFRNSAPSWSFAPPETFARPVLVVELDPRERDDCFGTSLSVVYRFTGWNRPRNRGGERTGARVATARAGRRFGVLEPREKEETSVIVEGARKGNLGRSLEPLRTALNSPRRFESRRALCQRFCRRTPESPLLPIITRNDAIRTRRFRVATRAQNRAESRGADLDGSTFRFELRVPAASSSRAARSWQRVEGKGTAGSGVGKDEQGRRDEGATKLPEPGLRSRSCEPFCNCLRRCVRPWAPGP